MGNSSIIRKNFILSLAFGILMGIVFPLYASFFVEYENLSKQIIFISGCIVAGIIVGLSAFLITKFTIIKVVKKLAVEMDHISKALVELTNQTLSDNAESFLSFSDLVRKIEEISNRTSVLSINASIEATRKGKDGVGFKVIAQEIRKLSGESEMLTTEINSKLSNSYDSVTISKNSITDFQNGYVDMLSDVQTGLAQVQKSSTAIKSNTDEVRANYKEITEMLSVIKRSLSNLKEQSSKAQKYLNQLEESTNIMSNEILEVRNESVDIEEFANNTQNDVQLIEESVDGVSSLLHKYKTGVLKE